MNGELCGDAEEWVLTGIVFGAIGMVAALVGLDMVALACGLFGMSCILLGWTELLPR